MFSMGSPPCPWGSLGVTSWRVPGHHDLRGTRVSPTSEIPKDPRAHRRIRGGWAAGPPRARAPPTPGSAQQSPSPHLGERGTHSKQEPRPRQKPPVAGGQGLAEPPLRLCSSATGRSVPVWATEGRRRDSGRGRQKTKPETPLDPADPVTQVPESVQVLLGRWPSHTRVSSSAAHDSYTPGAASVPVLRGTETDRAVRAHCGVRLCQEEGRAPSDREGK
ncbi:hypothetical protein H920_15843 [Fukomys damarensis]|uniref:Uncharacterized protein n=1 Tax=Fukomys damarensis TaxID=885580 RepID=A0A091CXZ8_FUKDA|nr:hypothetical protein H920_15843 [Fukomys damarensis]